MKKLAVALVIAAVLGVGAISALAATRTVRVGDDYFVSRTKHTVTVKRRTLVRWRWVGDNPHNLRVYRGPVKFRSSVKTSGSFSRRLNRRGTYRIVCDIHARTMKMTLKVV